MCCSTKCLKVDRKRHAADCKDRLNFLKTHSEMQEKEKTLNSMTDLRNYATGGFMPGEPRYEAMQAAFQGKGVSDELEKRKNEVDKMREDICTLGLKLRNKQLHHATDMYQKRNNIEKVGVPPHDSNCYYCKKPANVEPKTFQTNMSRCSRCMLVRCE